MEVLAYRLPKSVDITEDKQQLARAKNVKLYI